MYSLIQRQMILWTFGLVLVFGVGVGLSLLQPPSTLAKIQPKTSSERQPASIPPLAAEVPNHIVVDPGAQVSDFNVTCEATSESNFAETVQQVRLRGRTCLPNSKARLKSAQVRNLSNGFVATVFTPDDSRFSTDYINLKAGLNQIVVDMDFSDGSKLARKLLFSRDESTNQN